MRLSDSLVSKLTEETNLIASENPSFRIDTEKSKNLAPLALAINRLADRYEETRGNLEQKIQHAATETQEEKNILAAFVSELPEAVLICNAEGQILLYNKKAIQFSDIPLQLGCSVFNVIDKNLIEHALDEINEKLKRKVGNAVSHFIVENKENHVFNARTIAILNRQGQFTGFILILSDITEQREADNRTDSLLQSLTKSARSPLASIRSAIEAILEYPDMDKAHLQRFRDIIYKESITLSNILDKVADDYSSFIKTQRSLVSMFGTDLLETLKRRAKNLLGILVNIEESPEKIRIKADSYSITAALLFVLNQLKDRTGIWEFTCKLEKDKSFVNLDLLWHGNSVGTETLRTWEDRLLIIKQEKSLLTLKEVLGQHEAEIWSYSGKTTEEQSYIRFLLPADESSEPDTLQPLTILPEAYSEFYNFELFNRPGRNPALDNRLLTELTYTVLIREIAEAKSLEEVIGKHSQLPGLIHNMIRGGAKVQNVTWLITIFSDAVLKRLISFAIEELGPPPVNFAFVILGSEGRKEQTLKTDQDNAIIIEDMTEKTGKSADAINDYFSVLGDKVCTWLDQAGYDFCTGDIMAKNPKWCQPLSAWQEYFSEWIHAAEPEDLLHSSIFFDFRFAYGDQKIVDSLGKFLSDSLAEWTGFFRHMTENAVFFKPPLGFFGNFTVESKGKHRNCLDIKAAMTPIVDFARIYALKHNIRETNTQERLYHIYLKKVISREEYNEIEQAYSFMMQLRFVRQITAITDEKVKPDNYINPKKLSILEQKMLKESLKRTDKMQTKLSFEFTGGSDSHMR
ncbi:MAG: PAS domain-containing protein [Desulfobacteraceae bacterium]|nr:PAS domain-containing protein [Desulfobacteraceae bacterium]